MVQDRKGHNLKIARLLEYPGADQIYIEIKDKFRKRGNYTLNLRYTTKLSQEFVGFYISSYINKDGERRCVYNIYIILVIFFVNVLFGLDRYLATTHFEPTYARAAFPCFDEPNFKAKFKMSIFRDRFHIALFNTPVIKSEDVGFYMGTGLVSTCNYGIIIT